MFVGSAVVCKRLYSSNERISLAIFVIVLPASSSLVVSRMYTRWDRGASIEYKMGIRWFSSMYTCILIELFVAIPFYVVCGVFIDWVRFHKSRGFANVTEPPSTCMTYWIRSFESSYVKQTILPHTGVVSSLEKCVVGKVNINSGAFNVFANNKNGMNKNILFCHL